MLTQHGVVTCADPAAREDDAYTTLLGGNLPATEENLQGAGLILADFTGDGLTDMLIPGEFDWQYWVARGAPDPSAAQMRVLTESWIDAIDLDNAVGGIAGDVNGDGWMDAVITRWGRPNVLLLNDGTGRFVDATPVAFLTHSHYTQSATLADLDLDGDLDLVFGSYGEKPDDAQDPNMIPAQPSELYRNDGGTWSDLSLWLPREAHDGYTFMTTAIDLNEDLLPEVLLWNDFGLTRPSVLLWNQGGFAFQADETFHPDFHDMGVGVGDPNGDGVPDFLLSSHERLSVHASGEAVGLPGLWFESSDSWNLDVDLAQGQHFGWGTDWGDVDNDADLDAVMVFGHWDDWPGLVDPQHDALFIQVAPLQFQSQATLPQWGLDDAGAGRGLVVADWNQDGWLDVVKRQVDDSAILHTARCGAESWIEVLPRAPSPNTFAIGSKIRVTAGGVTQTRWIMAGGTGQYCGQPPEAHVGLGAAEVVDRIEVIWPDGEVSVVEDVPARQRVTLTRQ